MATLTTQNFVGTDLQVLQEKAAVLLTELEQEQGKDIDVRGIRQGFMDVHQIAQKYNNEDAEERKLDDDEVKMLTEYALKVNSWRDASGSMRSLAEIIVLYINTLIFMDTSKYLIDSTLEAFQDINYYDRVLSSKHLTLLYFIQTLPAKTFKFLMDVKNVDIKKTTEIPYWVPEIGKKLVSKLIIFAKSAYKLLDQSMSTFFSSPTAFIIEKHNDSKSMFNTFWNSTFKVPYLYSKYELETKRKSMVAMKRENIKSIGTLFMNIPSYDNNRFNASNTFIGDESDTGEAIENMIEFIHTRPTFLSHIITRQAESASPSYMTRTWPLYFCGGLLALSYAPSVIYNIHRLVNDPAAREELYMYCKSITSYVYETSVSFWNNWIIEPINNILKTIRHDDQSEIALMSQKSLETDLKSLERMVLEYIEDSSLDIADKNAVIDNVKFGDLSVIMNEYERELKSPIKSIIRGEMLRNLLIQIQKTKVDGTLALNGVDKILKSQELVFGFVAASPSILIVMILRNMFMNWYSGENVQKNKKLKQMEICRHACKSLGSIEKIIDHMVVNERKEVTKPSQDCYMVGLLFIEVKNLKKIAQSILPNYSFETFSEDIDELINKDTEVEFKLLTIQRIWNVYGSYFK